MTPKKRLFVCLIFIIVIALCLSSGCIANPKETNTTVTPVEMNTEWKSRIDALNADQIRFTFNTLPLRKIDSFNMVVIGNTDVYWTPRVVNGAIVEGDSIVLQVENGTRTIVKSTINWQRPVASERLPVVSKETAESMVKGTVRFSRLYYLKPDSIIYPIKPTPQNPCWVVRSTENGAIIVTIIDAVTGEILGYGMPPPSALYAVAGTENYTHCNYDEDGYMLLAIWANYRFHDMGYTTTPPDFLPTGQQIKQQIQNTDVAIFYEFGHSHEMSDRFQSGCSGDGIAFTYASDIQSWIANYPKMPFTFLGSCSSMCDTGPGSLSYAFRNGSMTDTATVGFCGMANGPNDPFDCSLCLDNYSAWQYNLFTYMLQGETVKEALDKSIMDYPACAPCVQFDGDQTFKVVPIVQRVPDNTLTMELCQGGTGTYHIGDTIVLCGLNSISSATYLVLIGPNLDSGGVILTDLSTKSKYGYYTIVATKPDKTWEYQWHTNAVTGGTLDPGVYTIYAADAPGNLSNIWGPTPAMLSIVFKA